MKILVLGWYGHNNIGDDSYKIAFPKLFPEHTFEFTSNISHNDYDCVVLGGGNVFSNDFLGQLRGLNKPVFGMSLGLDRETKNDVPFVHVYAREQQSLEWLKCQKTVCSFLPDFAFALEPDIERGKFLLSQMGTLYEKKVAIVVNSYLINGGQGQKGRESMAFLSFAYELARGIDAANASFIFIPFGTEIPADDRVANSWVANKCKFDKKNVVIYGQYSVQDTLNIISACDAMVSTRLHATIFAHNAGIPFVDITHHNKNKSFLDLIGQKDSSIPYWGFSSELFCTQLDRALASPRTKNDLRSLLIKGCNDIRFDQKLHY